MENGSLKFLRFSVWMKIALSTILHRIHVCSRSTTTAARNRGSGLGRDRHRRRWLDTLRSRRIIRILRERSDRTAGRRRLLLVVLNLVIEDRADIATRRREDLRVVDTPRDPEALIDHLDARRDHEIGLDTLGEDVRDRVRTNVDRNALVIDDRRLDDAVVDRDLETDTGCVLAVGHARTIRLAITGSREIRTITVRHALLATRLTEPASTVCDRDVNDLVIEIVEEVLELSKVARLRTGTRLIVRVATRETAEELVVNLTGLLILADENTTGEAHLGESDLEILTVLLERDCDTALRVLARLGGRELGDLEVAGGDDRGRHLGLRVYLYHSKKGVIRFHRLFSDFRGRQENEMCGRTETRIPRSLSTYCFSGPELVWNARPYDDSTGPMG